MNKTKRVAIRHFCADCAGSPLDTTLCTILYCELWPFRIMGLGTKGYEKRVRGAFSGKGFTLKETLRCGLTLDDYLHPTADSINKTRPKT